MPSDVKIHSLPIIYGRQLSLYHTEEESVEWSQLIFWSRIQRMFHLYIANQSGVEGLQSTTSRPCELSFCVRYFCAYILQ
jgi:hypothetical protein